MSRELSVGEALAWARARLAPSESASLDAQLLLGHAAGMTRAGVLARREAMLTADAEGRFRELVERRASGVPVAYLRGWIEWYGRVFDITEDVLVPRPETELVLERAVALAREMGARTLADIGTGSGVLAIGLALQLPAARVYGVDVSAGALSVAARNAARHEIADRVLLLQGDLVEPLPQCPDLVVANLPYLSDEMMTEIGADVRHEPDLALRGGTTGLELVERLRNGLRVRGWRVPLVLEIDPRQSPDVPALFPEHHVDITADYAGRDRVVTVLPVSR